MTKSNLTGRNLSLHAVYDSKLELNYVLEVFFVPKLSEGFFQCIFKLIIIYKVTSFSIRKIIDPPGPE